MIVLHHLASSGGTVFLRALAAQGNCAFLNEINPYFSVIPAAGFSPTTVIDQYLARYHKDIPESEAGKFQKDLFHFQLRYLHERVGQNRTLLVREWSHGDFFASDRFSSSILPLLDFTAPRSLVTMRHPVDCYLSGLTYNAWNPIGSDISEFCRRYKEFCRYFLALPGAIFVKYEDFAADPDTMMADLCEKLGLEFNPDYQEQLGKYKISGASGRISTDKIAPRPRRSLSSGDRDRFLQSDDYHRTCELAGYPAALSG